MRWAVAAWPVWVWKRLVLCIVGVAVVVAVAVTVVAPVVVVVVVVVVIVVVVVVCVSPLLACVQRAQPLVLQLQGADSLFLQGLKVSERAVGSDPHDSRASD